MIRGPQDSPYEGGVFELELFLPEEYPMAAPKVRSDIDRVEVGATSPRSSRLHAVQGGERNRRAGCAIGDCCGRRPG